MQTINKIGAITLAITIALSVPISGATKHTLKTTYISSGHDGTINVGNSGNVDSVQAVSCPAVSPATCTFEADQFIQVIGNSISGNRVFLCFAVDGAATLGCPVVGTASTDGSGILMSISQVLPKVSPGSHTVQTQVEVTGNAGGSVEIGFFTINYKVFTP